MNKFIHIAGLFFILCASAQAQEYSSEGGFGTNPVLPEPESSILPTVKVASVIGWKDDEKPIAANGFTVNAFAKNLNHPRWVYVLPSGDVLVAETNAPPKPDDNGGIKGFFTKLIMKDAGAGGSSPNRIILLRDSDNDGVAEIKTVFMEGLNSPFGMALIGNDLYIANTDAILKFPYHDGDTKIDKMGVILAELPAGNINHHWTKNIVASQDGKHIYASVGSNSNAGENGIENEASRAAILEIDTKTGDYRQFASGLRNPVGMAWQPQSGMLWTSVNERDELGDNLVPDYMTSVKDGAFYGWPYSYYGQHIDSRVKPQNPDMVEKAIKPDYALGSHTASLGLAFYSGNLFPDHFHGGAFIGQHGSWNRKPPSGYRVIFVPFKNGMPDGMPENILTGFLNDEGKAHGRPVGVAVDKQGALLVADDVGNAIWRVTPQK